MDPSNTTQMRHPRPASSLDVLSPNHLAPPPSSRPVSTASVLSAPASSRGSRTGVNQYKCVVVGDGGVGKTSMLVRFVQGDFFTDYQPTDFDSFTVSMALGDEWMPCTMTLVDTAGQETYDRLRTLTYYDADVFIVCFSVANPDSFINVRARWIPELREFKPKTPIILVGTQSDLREQLIKDASMKDLSLTADAINASSYSSSVRNNETPSSNGNNQSTLSRHMNQSEPSFVTFKEGKRVAAKVKARMYSECSALTGEGMDKIFYQALMTAVVPKRKRRFWHRMKRLFAS